MTAKIIIHAMAEYHVATNRRLWQHCLQHVTDQQFTQPLGYSHGTLREQVVHLAQTDRYWLHDIQTKPVTGLNSEDYPTLASFTATWYGIGQMLLDYVAGLDERALSAVPDGLLETRWEALMHVFTHGTDHRAQILSMLHGLGVPTFEQDFGDHRRRHRRVTKAVVLRLISFRFAEWEQLVASLPAEQLEQVLPGGWTVKDTLSHLTWYDQAMVEMLQERRRTRAEEWGRPRDERNRRIHEQQSALPLDAVREGYASTHRALVAAIEALEEDELNNAMLIEGLPPGTLPWMELERHTWVHYLEHTEALWALLGMGPKA